MLPSDEDAHVVAFDVWMTSGWVAHRSAALRRAKLERKKARGLPRAAHLRRVSTRRSAGLCLDCPSPFVERRGGYCDACADARNAKRSARDAKKAASA